MVSSVHLLCTDPDGFFRRDPKEWEGLAFPGLLVLLAGILAASSAFLVTPVMLRIIPENMLPSSGIVSLLGALSGALSGAGALLLSFVAWVAYTLVFFVISLLFLGKGSFTRALAAVGWGFLPTAAGGLACLLVFLAFLPSIEVSPVSDPAEIQAAMAAVTHSLPFQLTTVIGIIFLLWSANIWIFGIRSAREISLRNAAITVGIPVLAFILITILMWGFFT